MATDDEIVDQLRQALAEPSRQPAAERIAALRAQAAEAQPPAPAPARRRPSLLWAAAVVAILAVAGLVVGLMTRDGPAGRLEFAGPISGATGVEAEATVRRTGIGRVVRLETDQLPILPTGEFYELWFVSESDTPARRDRISAGTFHPDADGRTRVQLAAAVDPTLYPIMVVTAEPGDGNPEPTGPEVLRGLVRSGP